MALVRRSKLDDPIPGCFPLELRLPITFICSSPYAFMPHSNQLGRPHLALYQHHFIPPQRTVHPSRCPRPLRRNRHMVPHRLLPRLQRAIRVQLRHTSPSPGPSPASSRHRRSDPTDHDADPSHRNSRQQAAPQPQNRPQRPRQSLRSLQSHDRSTSSKKAQTQPSPSHRYPVILIPFPTPFAPHRPLPRPQRQRPTLLGHERQQQNPRVRPADPRRRSALDNMVNIPRRGAMAERRDTGGWREEWTGGTWILVRQGFR